MRDVVFRILRSLEGRIGDSPPLTLPECLLDPREILVCPRETLLVLPFVQVLRRVYPRAKIRVLVEERAAALSGTQEIEEVIGYERKTLSPLSGRFRSVRDCLRERGFDLAFLLPPNPSPVQDLLLYSSGARVRIGHHRPGNFPFLNFSVTSANPLSDELEGSFRLLRALGHRQSPSEPLEKLLSPDGLASAANESAARPVLTERGQSGELFDENE
jgi:ADP-heptose:LPS heptosyltransferase